MKLIDLLVQELPKRGGWPDGAERASVGDFNGNSITVVFCFPRGYSNGFDVPFQYTMTFSIPDCCVNVATDYCMVTRKQYESALSASQKPTWNGEGVPPVGCECEYSLNAGKTWWKCKIDYIVGTQGVVMLCDTFEGVQYVKFSSYGGTLKFRPIRTEADKKRDAAINNILTIIDCNGVDQKNSAIQIYDAIAAGKIPGVKLED
ncbi:hypothetical protein ACI5LO_004226 [Salmonella enterica subsp. enterica serovar Derby]